MIKIKTRIISAIVMLAFIIPVIILGGMVFKIFAILLGIGCMYEILKAKEKVKKIPIVIRIFSYLLVGSIIFLSSDLVSVYTLDYRFFVVLFSLLFIPIIFIADNKKYNIEDGLFLIGAILFIGVGINSFVITRNLDIMYIFYLLLITSFTDMFALFGGKFLGKNKLCEKISPNKTIEGSIVGSFVGTIVASLFYIIIINPDINIFLIIGITLLLSIIGQLGDLFFSSIKRNYEIKDFSKLIPGHGGLLDRIDSLIFVMISFMIFINIL